MKTQALRACVCYYVRTMRYLLLGLLFMLPVATHAYVPTFAEPETVDDNPVVEEMGRYHNFYGELTGFPHMFSISVPYDDTEVRIEILVPKKRGVLGNMSGILVKQEERGVSEVTRMYYADYEWEARRDWSTGDSYLYGGDFTETLGEGEYFFEVSNGENLGHYVLRVLVGEEEPQEKRRYGQVLIDIVQMKSFMGKSPFSVLLSPFYAVPTLALLLVGFWWYRRIKRHA